MILIDTTLNMTVEDRFSELEKLEQFKVATQVFKRGALQEGFNTDKNKAYYSEGFEILDFFNREFYGVDRKKLSGPILLDSLQKKADVICILSALYFCFLYDKYAVSPQPFPLYMSGQAKLLGKASYENTKN